MLSVVFEIYGAFCLFSLIVFLILAAVAKLRPDLDDENFEELEKLRKLANSRPSDASLIDDLIIEELWRAARARPVKTSKRPIRGRPHMNHLHKPRTI